MSERVIIVGAGQAGVQGAVSLRQFGFDGEIVMIGAEPVPPYQRPPLSKAYLKGELEAERLFLRSAAFFEAADISLRMGEAANHIDTKSQIVSTDKGTALRYDKLLLTTGTPPRRLNAPGTDLSSIYYLRTLANSDALRSILAIDGRIVIIGGGYIGLEVAAVARQAGRQVTVLEVADRVLGRVSSPPVSDFYGELHWAAGVDIRVQTALTALLGKDGKVTGAQLVNGEVVDCAAALIGIGGAPETALAAAAGLTIANGIVVDDHAQTSNQNIWAAGDCTSFPSNRYGRHVRLESVPNAMEQAKVAAANMTGNGVVYDPLPWFWSDQYDVKLQTVGLSEGYDELVMRGVPATKTFAVWYFKDGAVLAVDAINDPASFACGKRLIGSKKPVDASQIADSAIDLKTLL